MLLSPDFAEALTFATHLHSAQTRKGTESPYVSHLLRVAGLVLEYGGNEDEAIAALLHDAVEDQGGQLTRERIRRRFGSAVADVVEACSDTDVEPKPAWRPRKDAYLAHVGHASCSADPIRNQ
jgi:(p)ppGpp synthase/HD superfamily hydrolase